MEDTVLNLLVLELINAELHRDREMFVKQHQSMAGIYPDGVDAYIDRQIYKTVKRNKKNSLFAYFWVYHQQPNMMSMFGAELIVKFANHWVNAPNMIYNLETIKEPVSIFTNAMCELRELNILKNEMTNNKIISDSEKDQHFTMTLIKGDKFEIFDIALFCYYSKKHIDKDNATAIALEYGYDKPGRLLPNYRSLKKTINRLSVDPMSKTKNQNKIAHFEKVIDKLDITHRETAEDELKTIKDKINNVF